MQAAAFKCLAPLQVDAPAAQGCTHSTCVERTERRPASAEPAVMFTVPVSAEHGQVTAVASQSWSGEE